MVYWILFTLNVAIKLLGLIAGICQVKMPIKIKEKVVFGVFLIVSFLSELISFFFAYFNKNNMPVFHVFTPVMTILFGYYLQAINPRLDRWHFAFWLALTITLVFIIDIRFFESWDIPDSLSTITGCGLVMVGALDTLVVNTSNKGIYADESDIKILYGMIAYELGTVTPWIFLGVFLPGHYPQKIHKIVFWTLYAVSNGCYLLWAILLLQKKQRKTIA